MRSIRRDRDSFCATPMARTSIATTLVATRTKGGTSALKPSRSHGLATCRKCLAILERGEAARDA